MKLRALQISDAPHMLEWMHDENVVAHLGADFAAKTMEDCERFITAHQEAGEDLHLAVADEADTYMGTVSLKHMDRAAGTAEFAISMRSCAMGKGYSAYGMREILRMGLEEQGLRQIYWCVCRNNERAVRFYDKNGYRRTRKVPEHITAEYTPEQLEEFIWFLYDGKQNK